MTTATRKEKIQVRHDLIGQLIRAYGHPVNDITAEQVVKYAKLLEAYILEEAPKDA